MAGEDIQTLDHTEGVERGPGRLGPHIGHAEDLPVFKFFFQISNDSRVALESSRSLKQAWEAEGRGDLIPGGSGPAALNFAVNFSK
jgi:hypothetical protein